MMMRIGAKIYECLLCTRLGAKYLIPFQQQAMSLSPFLGRQKPQGKQTTFPENHSLKVMKGSSDQGGLKKKGGDGHFDV